MKVAIIGAGRQGHRRAKSITETGDEITLVVDKYLPLTEEFVSTFGCKASSDWNDAINDKKVDALMICTPNDTHAEIAKAALKAGKHVLVEKPLARNPDEAKGILDALKASKSILKCGFNLRYHPAIAQAKKHVESGKIGKIIFMRARYGNTSRQDFEKDWRIDVSISGGGELMDQGQHVLDLFRWFGGEISEVMGYTDTLAWNVKPAEDNAFALLRANAGHVCTLHVSWSEWRNIFSLEVFGSDGYVKIEGLGGSYGHERLIMGKKDLSKPFSEEVIDFGDDEKSFREEWEDFSSAVKAKKAPMGTGYDGWAAVKLAYCIYESSKSKKAVKFDLKGA